MVVLGLVGIAASAAAWIGSGPAIGAGVAALVGLLLLMVKGLMELAASLSSSSRAARETNRRLKDSVDGVTRMAEATARQSDDLAGELNTALARIDKAERDSTAQERFGDSVLKRVRAVESATTDNAAIIERVRALEAEASRQGAFDDAVLDRVRKLESGAAGHRNFGDTVLGRIRAVESAAGTQQGFNDAVLDRIRTIESRLPAPRTPPVGQPRRLERARTLIAEAESALEQSALVGDAPNPDDWSESAPAGSRVADHEGPFVSIVVACFNEERFIGEALESIRRQSFDDWECIVVDDASTDRSVEIIETYLAVDSRFRLLRHEQNREVSAARNTGLRAARAPYVVFHDADDLLMSASLADRFEVMEQTADPDVAGVYCGIRVADEGVALDELPAAESWQPSRSFVDFVAADGECPFGLTAALVRTDVVRSHSGFNEDMTVAEDWDLWLRIMRSGFYFRTSEFLSVVYRQKSMSKAQTAAVSHVQASTDLIRRTHAAAQLADVSPASSYPFPLALSHYQELLTRARRATQYAATALLRAEVEVVDKILATLEAGSWPLLKRHARIEQKIKDGFTRAAGLDATDLSALDEELEPLSLGLATAIRRVTG